VAGLSRIVNCAAHEGCFQECVCMSLSPTGRLMTVQRLFLPDVFERHLRNLRLSVTDRCNLRCQYCMPEEEYAWLPRGDLLTFEEIVRVVDVFADLGVDKD